MSFNKITIRLLVFATCGYAASLQAQQQPDENELFAAPAERTSQDAVQPSALNLPDTAAADHITIGGQIYLRAQTTALLAQAIEDYTLSVPTLLDVYLDARPNDRVRGFVLGRLSYDPMLPDSVSSVPSVGVPASDTGTSGSAALSSFFGVRSNAPQVFLDQLWLNFDLFRTLFVTVGRQHVRWGTARFWTPGDFLHQQRRNPLNILDARRGNDMLKLHLPIESTAWNFYLFAIAGGYNDTPSLYSVSGAARIELVAGSGELGLGVLLRRDVKPKLEADLSMALGPIDIYAEAAVLDSDEIDRVGFAPTATLPDPVAAQDISMADQVLTRIRQAVDTYYPVRRDRGYKPQVVAGLTYTQPYGDGDSFSLGIECFYNGLGYSTPDAYPGLLFPRSQPLQNPASFFYLGQQYAAVFLAFPAPFSLDLHNFMLTTLCNVSDRSCITRFDYNAQIHKHVRFEMYVAGVYGRLDGEFTFGIQTPGIDGVRLGRQPATFNAGLALRIGI